MKTKMLLKAAEKFVIDNSPGILTGLGVAGAVTTAVLTGKASWNSALLIKTEAEYIERGETRPFETKDKVVLVWKEFIPPVAVGIVTVAAIIGANSVGTRRTAAIAAAFKLSEQVNQDYKKKVLETLGLQKEEKLRSEIAAEKMTQNPPPGNMLIISGSNVLFFDELTGRYFENTMEKVQQAVNEVNYQVNQYNHASLSDFYWKIGLQATSFSDNVGWCLDELLDVQYSPVMYEGKPAIMIGYNSEPIKGFDRLQ
jgi:Family of unknown function (DUF6353)